MKTAFRMASDGSPYADQGTDKYATNNQNLCRLGQPPALGFAHIFIADLRQLSTFLVRKRE